MAKRILYVNEIKKWNLVANDPKMNEWQAEREAAGNTSFHKMETFCREYPGCDGCPLVAVEAGSPDEKAKTIYSDYWRAFQDGLFLLAGSYALDMVACLRELASYEGFAIEEEEYEDR